MLHSIRLDGQMHVYLLLQLCPSSQPAILVTVVVGVCVYAYKVASVNVMCFSANATV